MGTALNLSKTQILVLVLFILALIAIGLVVLHGVIPGIWHSLFPLQTVFVNHYH